MHNIVKWPNILQKSCGVHTASFLKYVSPFYNIMHERVKNNKNKNNILPDGYTMDHGLLYLHGPTLCILKEKIVGQIFQF